MARSKGAPASTRRHAVQFKLTDAEQRESVATCLRAAVKASAKARELYMAWVHAQNGDGR